MDSRFPPTPRLRRTGRGNDAAEIAVGGGLMTIFLIAGRGSWIPGSPSYAKATEDRASRRCRDLSEDDEKGGGIIWHCCDAALLL